MLNVLRTSDHFYENSWICRLPFPHLQLHFPWKPEENFHNDDSTMSKKLIKLITLPRGNSVVQSIEKVKYKNIVLLIRGNIPYMINMSNLVPILVITIAA